MNAAPLKVWCFDSSREEIVQLWKTFSLSVLDQSCVIWHSGLTEENRSDRERTHYIFVKLVLEEDYETYENALLLLLLETLKYRRRKKILSSARQSFAHGRLRDLFPLRRKYHNKKTRYENKYHIIQWKQLETFWLSSRFYNFPALSHILNLSLSPYFERLT